MKEFIEPLMDIGDKVTKLTAELGQMSVKNPDDLGAAAVPYLRVVGHLVYSYLWARMARVALDVEGPEKGTFTKAKRSEERRAGKECVHRCRSRGGPLHKK